MAENKAEPRTSIVSADLKTLLEGGTLSADKKAKYEVLMEVGIERERIKREHATRANGSAPTTAPAGKGK